MDYRRTVKFCHFLHLLLCCCYFVALLTCFIINLSVNGRLSWFFIVLESIALSFCIINVPLITPHRKAKVFLCLFLDTVSVLVLVPAIFASSIDLSFNKLFFKYYPIILWSCSPAWFIALILCCIKSSGYLKASLCLLVAGVFTLLSNTVINYFSSNYILTFNFMDNLPNIIVCVVCLFLAFFMFTKHVLRKK